MRRSVLLLALILLALPGCNNVLPQKEDHTTRNLILILAAAYASNPCNFTASPLLVSAQPSGNMGGASGSIRGKILTASGSSAIAALIVAEDQANQNLNFWSSHASIARDGTFFIAGIPATTNVKLSVEPIYSDFFGRIENHIDCFASPRSFTAGWASVPGASLVSTRASAKQYTINTGTTDAGTIYLNN